MTSSKAPIINEGMDTNAVVITIIAFSIHVFRRRAATAPNTMPTIAAIKAAITPSFIDVRKPSEIIVETSRPLCLREG